MCRLPAVSETFSLGANLMKSLTMIALAGSALLVACQSAPVADTAGAAELAGGPSEGPEMICRMEPVMGSRVRKQEVCSPTKFNNDAGDSLRSLHNDSGKSALSDTFGGG